LRLLKMLMVKMLVFQEHSCIAIQSLVGFTGEWQGVLPGFRWTRHEGHHSSCYQDHRLQKVWPKSGSEQPARRDPETRPCVRSQGFHNEGERTMDAQMVTVRKPEKSRGEKKFAKLPGGRTAGLQPRSVAADEPPANTSRLTQTHSKRALWVSQNRDVQTEMAKQQSRNRAAS